MNIMRNAKLISSSVTCSVHLAWNMSFQQASLRLEPIAQSLFEILVRSNEIVQFFWLTLIGM
jgi:hypothetical protein